MHRTEKQNTTLRFPTINLASQDSLQLDEDHNYDPPLLIVEARELLNEEQCEIIFLFLLYALHVSNITAIIGNSLNIAVFVKLGFSEPSNISLTALAASDLTCVLLSYYPNLKDNLCHLWRTPASFGILRRDCVHDDFLGRPSAESSHLEKVCHVCQSSMWR
ncbi:hypothetical protein PoB_005433300 [Plakobranchus ocellatus]|uniref:G-protein coupled receptors family 1 profile domain-containing protein n=1 Tax=Plakobranchus ocellatus TaxID=259542 RepID=A0AAV4C8I3_9GAST|nr:hypothetical protein PoB_005433300 [Plakobranchus ocellatus]